MKIKFLCMALTAILAFASCREHTEVKTITRPVKVMTVTSRNEINRDYSGVVEPVNFVKLAFRVPGQIISLPVVEGQKVKKGDLIAQVDPREINIQLSAAKANYVTAKAQLERNERLLQRQAVSLQEMESVRAQYEQARASYEAQTNNLADTYLRAPFDGFIAKRSVENYQRIQPGMSVAELVDPRDLQVLFTIPDRAIGQITAPTLAFEVEFENFPGQKFEAKLKEYVDASQSGAGIPVYLNITDPRFNKDEYAIKPGFACNVIMTVNEDSKEDGLPFVPLTAILGDPSSDAKYVWVYNKSNSTVEKRKVTTGSLIGKGDVLIESGLKSGEVIVIAGVTQLVEGLKVKVLK